MGKQLPWTGYLHLLGGRGGVGVGQAAQVTVFYLHPFPFEERYVIVHVGIIFNDLFTGKVIKCVSELCLKGVVRLRDTCSDYSILAPTPLQKEKNR